MFVSTEAWISAPNGKLSVRSADSVEAGRTINLRAVLQIPSSECRQCVLLESCLCVLLNCVNTNCSDT